MPSLSTHPIQRQPMPAGTVIETASRWVDNDEDLVLGCECANPALQIERWGQDDAGLQGLAR